MAMAPILAAPRCQVAARAALQQALWLQSINCGSSIVQHDALLMRRQPRVAAMPPATCDRATTRSACCCITWASPGAAAPLHGTSKPLGVRSIWWSTRDRIVQTETNLAVV